MVKPLSYILNKAIEIKNELVLKANTATRVGTWMENLAESTALEFDPEKEGGYKVNQWVIIDGVLHKCLIAAATGQSPATHPAKWSTKLVTDKTQVTVGNNLPVSASAVAQLLAEGSGGSGALPPYATENIAGIARKASKAQLNAGVANDVWVSPEDLDDKIEALNAGLNPDLQVATDNGNVTTREIQAAEFHAPSFPSATSATQVLVPINMPGGIKKIGVLNASQLLSSLGTGGTYTVVFEGCIDLPMPPKSVEDFTITNDKFNVPLLHNLDLPGDKIRATMTDKKGNPLLGLFDLTYPDNSHFVLSPIGQIPTDFSETLRLEQYNLTT
ncbi:hypothetical protein IC229_27515 [Spirosoma sp. BT702]|uniref:Uncharacterized protein n=1 Tax=Spirosoma profusum TaxID=2771354 RepID=A0A926Y5A7_9BACT|nr:hypothetical protein [Spirosoma profusum]MBD2704420.1 hypothetical protein [Spirosoma profusum]